MTSTSDDGTLWWKAKAERFAAERDEALAERDSAIEALESIQFIVEQHRIKALGQVTSAPTAHGRLPPV